MHKKKVIIATHEYSGIYKNFKHELEKNNYEVLSLIFTHYRRLDDPNPKTLLGKLIRKIKKRSNFSELSIDNNVVLYRKNDESNIANFLKKYSKDHFDYSLFVRADFFSLEIIKQVKNICRYNIAYHWDGLGRFNNILNKINLFDKFFVYEKNDYEKYKTEYLNLELTNSFYFENEIGVTVNPESSDVFFLGACKESRIDDIVSGYNALKDLNSELKLKIMLYYEDKKLRQKYDNQYFTFFDTPMEYSETLIYTKNTKVILDFLIKENFNHSGLSLRFFEALHYKKKIISDNVQVKNYDFYDPLNIFILGVDDNSRLIDFIQSPYLNLDKKIVEKYSFINWFEAKLS